MNRRGRQFSGTLSAFLCALLAAQAAFATGVPVGGFYPLVGMGLSNEYDSQNLTFNTYDNTSTPTAAKMLGNGSPFYDLALLDSGAGFSLLTAQAYNDFNIDGPYSGNSDGFAGTQSIDFGGATGTLTATVLEPLGLYAGGLQNRNGTAPFSMSLSGMKGQTNTSMITIPASSDLPNVIGLTYASRYTTVIHNDQPQIFTTGGRTVRSPSIDFLPLGSGGQGIARRAFMSLTPSSSFGANAPPTYFPNIENFDIDHPWADPTYPTLLQATTGGAFLNVTAKENNQQLGNSQFLFDTGADVTVVSSFTANQLGYQGVPDFTVAVVGSGGTAFGVPGFFVDDFTISAETESNHAANNVVLHNVPVIILDVTNPGDPGNTVPGIVGMNAFAGRNLVFDPKTSGNGGSLYVSDPVTIDKNWTSTAASESFGTGSNWSGGTAPTVLGIANVRHVAGANQTAVVNANATVWELNVSGAAGHTMTVQVQNGGTLQTFSGTNIEANGAVNLQGGTLDTQYVEMLGGTLSGTGTILTGSGPIPGQVENRGGTVTPGNGVGTLGIIGRFAEGPIATVAFELGGSAAGLYDAINVTGSATLDGTLAVTLVNGFVPSVGNAFTLLTTTDDIGGTFSNLLLPAGFAWNVAYNSNSVVLSVTGIGTPGDFNNDGNVNAADYVMWRNMGGTPQQYQDWRNHFGFNSGAGAGVNAANVPEPQSLLLLIAAGCGLLLVARRPTRPARCVASIRCEVSSSS
ncbi:MAG: aspartyl protease family protein [Pirellulales bacterium]